MRAVSQVWGALNASRVKERRFFIRIETTPGVEAGDVYIRSHDDVTITTDGVVLLAKPKSHPTIRTQTLNPDEGRATIGTMSFDAIDIDSSLTDEMRTALLSNDVGWRQKRVQYFSGFRTIGVDDYELEDTQLIDRVTYSQGVYQFRCRDIQREMRKQIFEPLVARLAQPLSATATTIEIFADPGFEAVEHGTSYSDGASATVLYVQIDDEIIRVPSTGIGATQLTSCVRGVLGTRAAAHTTDENASASRSKEVREVIYLELPVPKLVYALLTGTLIGQTGTLPAHWHLGIDAGDFVRLTDFQNIGADLYVQANDTLGMIERYILDDAEDGKAFIEREILRKYGLFMPIYADGAIGLRRGQPVLSGSAVAGVIDDSMIVDDVTLTYAMDKVVNEFRIGWNEVGGDPTRYLSILDTDSVTRWGTAPRLDVVARGLVGSRQTDSRVRDIFEGLRDRYSGPPLTCDVTVFSSQSLYEVGDVIRLRTSFVRDFTNSETSLLDRAFEIQGVSKNLSNGTVTYSLFGSSQKAGALPPLESTAALDDAFYNATGTNIAGMSGVVDGGTELVLPDGITFTGASTVAGAVYYALKDVRLPAGDVANYTQNVQLRIKGTLQIDGEFNGVGTGLAGVADTVDVSGVPNFGAVTGPVNFATQAGTPGYFGKTQAAGALIERVRQRDDSSSKYRVRLQSVPATITVGAVEAIPSLNLQVADDGLSIAGVPADLRGTSGGPGGVRHWDDSKGPTVQTNRGGTGGAGGAGLLIISRGMVFGASGRIVSSGANGSSGVRNGANEQPAWSGGGAGGAPGATLILLDGSSSASPTLTDGSIIADYGTTPEPGDPHNYLPDAYIENQETRFGGPETTGAFVQDDRVSFFKSSSSGLQAGIAAARFFFLLPPVEPEDDVDDEVLANAQDISIVVTEAFTAVEDATLTQILVTVTEVATTDAYSHAAIYTKRTTGDDPDPAFVFQGGADPKLRFILPADGETYTIRAVPVLINGVEATSGVEDTQIVSTPGLNRVVTSVSYNRANIWRRAVNAGAWTPSETTVDGTVEFVDTSGVVASRTVRATLDTSAGTITVNTSYATSGDATTATTSGSGTASLAVTVEHDDTGIKTVLNFAAVQSGSDGTSVTILGTLALEADLDDIVSPAVGDGYIIDGDLWVWDGSTWNNVGPIVGPAGDPGLSIAEVTVYKRATSAPSTPTGGSYDFDTKVLTTPSTWSVGVPAGTDPVYMSRSTAYIIGQSGSYSAFTWSSPVLAFQNGTDGTPGESVDIIFRRSATQPSTPAASPSTPASWYSDVNSVPAGSDPIWSSVGTRPTPSSDWTWQTPIRVEGQSGLSVAELSIYRRASSAPGTPTGGTYTFGTDTLNSIPSGWTRGIPVGTDPVYVSRAVASITGASGTSGTLTWSSPVLSMQNGGVGDTGAAGDAVDIVFKRSATQPTTPSPSSGTPATWYSDVASVPAGVDPIWSSVGQKASGSTTYTWDTPVRLQGQDGTPGLSVAELAIYRRAGSAPSTPTGGTYTFETDTLNSVPSGWTRGIPAGTDPVYVSRAVASISGAAGTTGTLTWSAPVLSFQNGTDGDPGDPGAPGDSVDIVFRRAATQPSTPSPSAGTPSGWYSAVASVPAGSDPIWSAVGKKVGGGTTYTWEVPILVEGSDGDPGDPGVSVAELIIYIRSSTAPAAPSGGNYTFETDTIGSMPAGWSRSIPAGTDPVYTSRAVASITGPTGTDGTLTWSSPVLSFQNGDQGAPGDAVDIIFRRSATQPATPSPSSGTPVDWYSDVASVPAGVNPIWSSVGQKPSGDSDYTWNTPVKLEGQDGDTGPSGLSVAELVIYRRASSAPATPTGGTYTFSTDTINSLPAGWSRSIPAGTDPVYTSRTVASVQGTGTTGTLTWSTPVLSIQNGDQGEPGDAVDIVFRRSATQPSTPSPSVSTPAGWYSAVASVPASSDLMWSAVGKRASGSATYTWETPILIEGQEGTAGISVAELSIYRRAAVAPATPSGGSYTFETDTINSMPGGWSRGIPVGTDPVYVSRTVASITGATGTDATLAWSSPVLSMQNGDQGDPGDSVDIVFKRSAIQPSLPAPSPGTPATWYTDVDSVPAGADPIWSSVGTKAGGAANYTWMIPLRVEGVDGDPGEAGLSVAELTIYRRSATAPATPAGGAYTFDTDTLSSVPAGWSRSVPAGTLPCYASRTVAAIVGQSGTDTSLTWSAPVISFQNGDQGTAGDSVDVIFRRSAAQPATPSPSAGVPTSWYSDVNSVPAGADPIWSSFGTRAGGGSTYTWQTPVKIEGQDGGPGDHGLSVAELSIYRRSSTAPATPTGGEYNFGTDNLSPLPSGWTRSIPAGTDPLYISRTVASVVGPTGLDTTLTWSSPVLSMQNGADGLSVAELVIYRRSPTVLESAPTGGSYNFGTVTLTPPASWQAGVPTGTDPVYASRAVASIVGQTGTDSTLTWSVPARVFQDGETGAEGSSVDIVFRRAATQPATPAASPGTPASWYSDVGSVPAGDDPLWSSIGTRPDSASNWTWQTPVKIEGADGDNGENGMDALAYAYNPTFEQGQYGWVTHASILIAEDAPTARAGTWRASRTSTGEAVRLNERKYPVRVGHRFAVSGWVRSSAGAAFSAIQWQARFYNAADVYLSAITGSYEAGPTTTYQFVSAFGTAPADASYVQLAIRVTNQTAGTVYWDEGQLLDINSIAVNVLLGGIFSDFIELASTGKIYSGKSTFDAAAAGFFLGLDGGIPKFRIGNADGSQALSWDGSSLTIDGDIIATGNIQAGAVTSNEANYTDAQLTVTASYPSWGDVQTLSITASGAPIVVGFSAVLNATGGGTAAAGVRLMRDGFATPLWDSTGAGSRLEPIFVENPGRAPISATIKDTPTAGAVTYRLQMCRMGGGGLGAANRSMNSLETKV